MTEPINPECSVRCREAIVPVPDLPLSVARPPKEVINEAAAVARELKKVLDRRPKKVVLNGERFLTYEDWLTAARFFGVTARVRSTESVTLGDHHGYKASAEAVLISTGEVIGSADSLCMTDEPRWLTRPIYAKGDGGRRVKTGDQAVPHFQRLSMAQTRACAKALRSVFSWVVVLAGYSPTPAEEMDTLPDFNQSLGYGCCNLCGIDLAFEDENKLRLCRQCSKKRNVTEQLLKKSVDQAKAAKSEPAAD